MGGTNGHFRPTHYCHKFLPPGSEEVRQRACLSGGLRDAGRGAGGRPTRDVPFVPTRREQTTASTET
jgi:hypothetical protein